MTQRICFQLRVDPELVDEYAERHREVWPEMRAALTDAGWRNYSLFLAADGVLTGYVECDDFEAALAAMAETDVNTRWQEQMRRFFVGLDGGAADAGISPIPLVFHLE